MRRDIEFNADGVTLRGWFYLPEGKRGPFPTVILAHGFTGTKEMTLDLYAEAFAKGGLAALVYDNRCLGDSDGEPRHDIDPVAQRRDYRYAITYAQSLPEVDPNRIGIWGTSYTGGTVLAVAAIDRRVKAVVSQVPFINGHKNILEFLRLAELPAFIKMLDEDRARRMKGEPSQYIPVTSGDPDQPAAFPGLRTHNFFHKFATQVKGIKWENKVTLRSIEYLLEYDVTCYLDRITPTPMMMIVSNDDTSTPTDIAMEAYHLAREPKELVILKADHYSSYLEEFDLASSSARDFYLKHL